MVSHCFCGEEITSVKDLGFHTSRFLPEGTRVHVGSGKDDR